jgi:cysteine desulfurase
MQQVYLDSNATTQPAPEVADAMARMLTELWGNPSSTHRFGQQVRAEIELARERVAMLIGAAPRDITFLSGGTESANLAIRGVLETTRSEGPPPVITTHLEHSTVRELVEYLDERGVCKAVWLPSDDGTITPDVLTAALDDHPDAALVSVQWASNETGLIQPIAELGAVCREREVTFHVDGTQWVGKLPTNVADGQACPFDLLTFSSHKFHGPKGAGALWARRGVMLRPMQVGGSQERRRRPGTENAAGIVGMGVAAELARQWLETPARDDLGRLRDHFEEGIVSACPPAHVNNADSPRLWNTSNIAFRRLEAEAILIALSERGIFASAGAACSSGSLEASPVLLAMGIAEEDAHGSVRFSLSRYSTDDEVEYALRIIPPIIQRLRG